MSPVIRISDSVFKRLQRLAEPFVDTPGAVVERLLDLHENNGLLTAVRSGPAVIADSPSKAEAKFQSAPFKTQREPNLFLAPAATGNVSASLRNEVPLDKACRHLESKQCTKLRQCLRGRKGFKCWAMTQSNKRVFSAMRPGDDVLLTVKGTGSFNYHGTILTTLESIELGSVIWPHLAESGRPWSLIYIFDELRKIDVNKSRLVAALGYEKNYFVPGVIQVKPVQVRKTVAQYGSFEEIIDSLSS